MAQILNKQTRQPLLINFEHEKIMSLLHKRIFENVL